MTKGMTHRLDLNALDLRRLETVADPLTLERGQSLWQTQSVEIVRVDEFTATALVNTGRRYRVEFKVAGAHLFLRCSCEQSRSRLLCEHEVAAWLGLHAHLENVMPGRWKEPLKALLSASQSQRSRLPREYFLFFSLQERKSYYGEKYWCIRPYTLPMSALPQEMRTSPAPPPEDEVVAYLQKKPVLLHTATALNLALAPERCVNCPKPLVAAAGLIAERGNNYGYSFSLNVPPNLLANDFALLREEGARLYLGTEEWPLKRPLILPAQASQIVLTVTRQEAVLHLTPQLLIGEQVLPLSPNETVILSERPLWLLSGSYLVEISNPQAAPLLDLVKERRQLVIPPEEQEEFAQTYLLDLAEHFPLRGEALTWHVQEGPPVPHLYLSDGEEGLVAELRFAYGDVEVPYDPSLPRESLVRGEQALSLVRVRRDPEAEKRRYQSLSSSAYGLKRLPGSKGGRFTLRAKVHPVDFLLSSVPKLAQASFVVYGEESLKSARVNRSTPSISFRVSSGIDWFDVHAVITFGGIEVPFREIRRALRARQRFVKLADGSIGELPEEWIERYRALFGLGEAKDDHLRLSPSQITLLEEALTQADQVEADNTYQQQRQRLRTLLEAGLRGIPSRPLPHSFQGELRPYQKAGYDWLHFLHEWGFGGCLADDMGLGKTIQTLAFIQSLYEAPEGQRPKQASLLVVPRSLLVNWQREAARFTPNLRLMEYFESDRRREVSCFDQANLVITTYGVMLRDIRLLHGYTFYYAILDESQAIKNPLSQTARAAHLLRAHHRLVLTGTPIENSTAELWSQFAFLNPGMLGSLNYFKREFGLPIESRENEAALQRLRRLVYPFILRRTKDQVAPELPPRSERILYCDMEAAQRKLYEQIRDYYRALLLGLIEEKGLENSRIKILEGLLRLRQVCIHPALVDNSYADGSAKFELLLDTLETLHAAGHKALVFSQFVKVLSLLRRELDQRGVTYAYLDGSTTARQEEVDRFQRNPTIPFFLISLRAGGVGLNLTAADYVIHIDPWWNPAVEMQASDRTHRIGQDKPVFVFKLIARDSVEEKILLLQERKRRLAEQLITTEKAFFKSLTREDVEALFGAK